MVMDVVPELAPGSRPHAGITFMNLDLAVLSESILDLENGRPKG